MDSAYVEPRGQLTRRSAKRVRKAEKRDEEKSRYPGAGLPYVFPQWGHFSLVRIRLLLQEEHLSRVPRGLEKIYMVSPISPVNMTRTSQRTLLSRSRAFESRAIQASNATLKASPATRMKIEGSKRLYLSAPLRSMRAGPKGLIQASLDVQGRDCAAARYALRQTRPSAKIRPLRTGIFRYKHPLLSGILLGDVAYERDFPHLVLVSLDHTDYVQHQEKYPDPEVEHEEQRRSPAGKTG